MNNLVGKINSDLVYYFFNIYIYTLILKSQNLYLYTPIYNILNRQNFSLIFCLVLFFVWLLIRAMESWGKKIASDVTETERKILFTHVYKFVLFSLFLLIKLIQHLKSNPSLNQTKGKNNQIETIMDN